MIRQLLILSFVCVVASQLQPTQFRFDGPDRDRSYGRRRTLRLCRTSSDCRAGECCRDNRNNVLSDDPEAWDRFNLGPGAITRGVCRRGKAQRGERCDMRCDCSKGSTCYRPLTGACCPPRTCWDSAEVDRLNDIWRNCKPPNCFFPA